MCGGLERSDSGEIRFRLLADQQRVWMLGGRSSGGVLSDWSYLNLLTNLWTTPDCLGETVSGREKHTLTFCLNRFMAAGEANHHLPPLLGKGERGVPSPHSC